MTHSSQHCTNGELDSVVCAAHLAFDTVNYDFAAAKLAVGCWTRDYDSLSANENGYGYTTIYGAHFLDNGGKRVFEVRSSDFAFNVEMTLGQSGRWK